jgi:hypothetical protein
MNRRKQLAFEHCVKIAEEHGGECLERAYISCETKMMWRCKEGHTWSASMNSVGQGRWCRICGDRSSASKRSKSIKDCNDTAADRRGKCLSTTYINISSKMEWQCEYGHTWFALAGSVLRGSWCAACARSRRLTLEDCHKAAAEHGGQCLSKEYVNSVTKLKWACRLGHTWLSGLNGIRQGSWCLVCSGSQKKTIEDARKLALSKGGACLSESYTNGDTHLVWQCSSGHKWSASFGNVSRGTWCGECKCHKSQRLLAGLIGDVTGKLVVQGYKRFDWLKTRAGRLELDVWVPDLKLAVEYDGEQHFKPVRFGGMSKDRAKANLISQRQRDRTKNRVIRKHADDVRFFIRFSYKECITAEYVREKLTRAGVLCIESGDGK